MQDDVSAPRHEKGCPECETHPGDRSCGGLVHSRVEQGVKTSQIPLRRSNPMTTESTTIGTEWQQDKIFPPPAAFTAQANAGDPDIYEQAARDFEGWWAGWARELDWIAPWERVLEWNPPHAKWFVGGKLNVSANCLDRHLNGPRRDKRAIVWEGEPGDQRTLTYAELHAEVSRFAGVLKRLGTGKGDRVMLYMPMVPEAA